MTNSDFVTHYVGERLTMTNDEAWIELDKDDRSLIETNIANRGDVLASNEGEG